MKGKYFFIENRKEIEIKEFDYKYVRNSFLKEYDRKANRQYCYTVIVDRTYDPSGEPVFDVRVLDLNDIYFDNTRLRMLGVMIDEISWDKNVSRSITNMPMPPLQKEYQEYLEGKKRKAIVVEVDNPKLIELPPAPELVRVPVLENDNRIKSVEIMFDDHEIKPNAMVVLDWVDNFQIASYEATVKMRNMTEMQIKMASNIVTHSDYIHSVMSNVSKVLEEIFPVNPGFLKKMFGSTDFKVDKSNLDEVILRLTQAARVDNNRFSGIQKSFNEIKNLSFEIKNELDQGVLGCKFAIATIEDSFEFEHREERLLKMGLTANLTGLSMIDAEKKFDIKMAKFDEIQTVLLPILIMRIQDSVDSKLDDETVQIIRNIVKKDDK